MVLKPVPCGSQNCHVCGSSGYTPLQSFHQSFHFHAASPNSDSSQQTIHPTHLANSFDLNKDRSRLSNNHFIQLRGNPPLLANARKSLEPTLSRKLEKEPATQIECLWNSFSKEYQAKMSTAARRRLMRDFKRMQTDPPAGVSASPIADNVMTWYVSLVLHCHFLPPPSEDYTLQLYT